MPISEMVWINPEKHSIIAMHFYSLLGFLFISFNSKLENIIVSLTKEVKMFYVQKYQSKYRSFREFPVWSRVLTIHFILNRNEKCVSLIVFACVIADGLPKTKRKHAIGRVDDSFRINKRNVSCC